MPNETLSSSLEMSSYQKKIVQYIDVDLKPLPTSVTRVLNAVDNQMSNAGFIGELLGLDHVLAARVLQAANSAYLGYGPSCSSLTDAVVRLGFRRVKTMVLGVVTSSSLETALKGYQYSSTDLWNHSIAVATAAQWIARAISYENPEEAYVAGLIHDIGKTALNHIIVVIREKFYTVKEERDLPFYRVERLFFGLDHAYVGGMMAKKWNFPERLLLGIKHHHTPNESTDDGYLASIVNIANACNPYNNSKVNNYGTDNIHSSSFDILGLSKESVFEKIVELFSYYQNS
ncbi:MAG: HDOD domain-containing protein [Anaerolineaceae bacterium]|nr:HDOD domain-containing protein [Anaerolineaceae bacterium]